MSPALGKGLMRRTLLFIGLLASVIAPVSSARADDWEVQRSEFDPRIVARYKAMLSRSPNDGYALGKLLALYKKHKSVAALIAEYRAQAKASPGAFSFQLILGHLYRRSGST